MPSRSAAYPHEADLLGAVKILKRRAALVSDLLTHELEDGFPNAYESVYWLARGVGDYLTAFDSLDKQVQWALDLLASVPHESGQEIGELIEARRG